MKDKVNGKTPEEIKKGLECCFIDDCNTCPYEESCFSDDEELCETMVADALAYIQQLERERDQYKRERDAAVDDLARYAKCVDCKRWNYVVYNHTTCEGCEDGSNWQWHGVQQEVE